MSKFVENSYSFLFNLFITLFYFAINFVMFINYFFSKLSPYFSLTLYTTLFPSLNQHTLIISYWSFI